NTQTFLTIARRCHSGLHAIDKMSAFGTQRFTAVEGNQFGVGFNGSWNPILPFDPMRVEDQFVFGSVVENRHLVGSNDNQTPLFKGMQPAYKDVSLHSAGELEVA